jgi:hypothetical protein
LAEAYRSSSMRTADFLVIGTTFRYEAVPLVVLETITILSTAS